MVQNYLAIQYHQFFHRFLLQSMRLYLKKVMTFLIMFFFQAKLESLKDKNLSDARTVEKRENHIDVSRVLLEMPSKIS